MKGCYSRFHFHVLDYCQWLRMPHKQIDLWGIASTSGHIKYKQPTFALSFIMDPISWLCSGHSSVRGATRDFIFMFMIIANDCACLMIYLFLECLVNKLNYGILHKLPATSGHIKSKQQTFTLIIDFPSNIKYLQHLS